MLMIRIPKAVRRRDAILSLSREGHDPAAIAATLGTSPAAVRSTLSKLRRAGEDVPRARAARLDGAGLRISVSLPDALAARLEAEAAARGVSSRDLAAQVIACALRDDMVGAILDDGTDA